VRQRLAAGYISEKLRRDVMRICHVQTFAVSLHVTAKPAAHSNRDYAIIEKLITRIYARRMRRQPIDTSDTRWLETGERVLEKKR